MPCIPLCPRLDKKIVQRKQGSHYVLEQYTSSSLGSDARCCFYQPGSQGRRQVPGGEGLGPGLFCASFPRGHVNEALHGAKWAAFQEILPKTACSGQGKGRQGRNELAVSRVVISPKPSWAWELGTSRAGIPSHISSSHLAPQQEKQA